MGAERRGSNVRDPENPLVRRRCSRSSAPHGGRVFRPHAPRSFDRLLRAANPAAGAAGAAPLGGRRLRLALPLSRGPRPLPSRRPRFPHRLRILRSVPDVHGLQRRHGDRLLRRQRWLLELDATGSTPAHRRSRRERTERELRSGVRRAHVRAGFLRPRNLLSDGFRARGRPLLRRPHPPERIAQPRVLLHLARDSQRSRHPRRRLERLRDPFQCALVPPLTEPPMRTALLLSLCLLPVAAFAQSEPPPPPPDDAQNVEAARPPDSPPDLQPPPPPGAPPARAESEDDDDQVGILQQHSEVAPQRAPYTQPVPRTAGQWVFTGQYGWVWMPYGTQYVDEGSASADVPYAFVYTVRVGWCWVAAPWVWGWGPYPYFGVRGPRYYGWYRGLYRSGWGWGRYRGGGHWVARSYPHSSFRRGPARGGVVNRPVSRPVTPYRATGRVSGGWSRPGGAVVRPGGSVAHPGSVGRPGGSVARPGGSVAHPGGGFHARGGG